MTALRRSFTLLLLFFLAIPALAETAWEITVTSDHAAANVPIRVPLGEAVEPGSIMQVTKEDGSFVSLAQITKPSLLADDEVEAELNFILPRIKANEEIKLTATSGGAKAMSFGWQDTEGKHKELSYGGTPVLRYMYEAPDWSTKERLGETYKVYHHVYNPAGTTLLTKGPGGLFPHHRGLFFGFNRISYGDGQKADIWHCKNGETQEHVAVAEAETGPLLGRHRLAIDWHGQDKKVFAKEQRELTAYRFKSGTLIEFASRLESQVGPVRLDGDPQHAGFQFRATQHVPDKTKTQTYYVRPDGKGEAGKFRNWPGNKDHVNLPWNALCMVVDDQRYTVCYLDRPENPKESRFSERDYGRFGSYFEYELDENEPLELNYRIWLQEGEMSVEEVAAQSMKFVNAPKAVAKALESVN